MRIARRGSNTPPSHDDGVIEGSARDVEPSISLSKEPGADLPPPAAHTRLPDRPSGSGAGTGLVPAGTALPAESQSSQKLTEIPGWLWKQLREDPVHAPEHMALAAHQIHGPWALRWLEKKRRRFRHHPRMLSDIAKREHANVVRVTGAATGVGGMTTMVPGLAALVWMQTRLVFAIAASYGHDPRDPLRAAELLVIQELYPDVDAAQRALDGAGTSVAQAYIGKKLAKEKMLVSRLLAMAGKYGAKKLVVKGIPVLSIPLSAIANETELRAVARRARKYYEARPLGPLAGG